ncbi:MAG: DUF4340 domain-containing protein [Verrucomicrobia bacterium]|nr:DUF4340 domain-containing protein [Verrucomicrobiota bacterium]
MRTKVTLILLLLNVGVFFYIFKFQRGEELKGPGTVLGPETSNIHSLEIATIGSDNPLKLERSTDTWTLTQPLQWPANQFAVTRILSELQQLRPYATFAVADLARNGRTLADYGLEKPPLTLTYTPAQASPGAPAPKSIVLKIGDTSPVGNRLYVLSPDGQYIHVVNRSLAESLALRLEDLRSDTLFTIPVFEVRSFKLQPPAPAASIRIANDNNRWSFESPFPSSVRASKKDTVLAINGLHALRVKNFLDTDAIDNTRTGLTTPELQITLIGNNRRETLLIGSQVDPSATPTATTGESQDPTVEYYARMEDKTPVFTVSLRVQLLETLRSAQETLRDTRVLDIEPSNITTISLSAPNLPQVTLQRLESSTPNPATASWQVVRHNGERGPQTYPADREVVETLLQKLTQLTAERFVDDAPSASALEDFGFNRPAREIALARPQVGGGASTTLQIGASSGTEPVTYAKLIGQNYVYRVSNAILRDTPVSALAYRDRLIRELPAGAQITGLKLTDLTNNNVMLETALPFPAAATSVPALTPERRQAIESLATQLRTLRAQRFLREEFTNTITVNGEERPWRYRLDTTLSLVGGSGVQTSNSVLYFSERAGASLQYVGSTDSNLVFEAAQSLLDAFFAVSYGPSDPGPTPPTTTPAPPTEPASTPTPVAP